MNKLTSPIKIKTLSALVLAVCLGLWSAGFFDRYVFSFGISESFSKSEAQNLIGRKFKDICYPKTDSERKGEITGYSEHDFGNIFVNVNWEDGNKKLQSGYNKSYFNQCVKLANPE